MDNCAWDWGAITGFVNAVATIVAAILASLTAWFISKQWREPKTSEVLADESKKIYEFVHDSYQKIMQLERQANIPEKENAYDDIRLIRRKYLASLNLYHGILKQTGKDKIRSAFETYMQLLQIIFEPEDFDLNRYEKHKQALMKANEDFGNELLKFILHIKD